MQQSRIAMLLKKNWGVILYMEGFADLVSLLLWLLPVMSVLFDAMFSKITLKNEPQEINLRIGHVNNIPTMQFFTGISRNTQSKS